MKGKLSKSPRIMAQAGKWLGHCSVGVAVFSGILSAQPEKHPLAGANEFTPSLSHYFSWIDNTNEGSTEKQTMANLDFFQWMHDEYGMNLDIYALDAGAIDKPGGYGSIYSEHFKKQFPHGFGPIAEKAKSFGCRLGVWLGPDGFGDTPEEEKARTDMLVKLCRDYNFHLFKVDAVCGQLRDEKQDAFVNMLKECRKYTPDLIVINHRLNLGHGLPYTTTKLWAGEAYIDVWRGNEKTATHNRAVTIELGVPVDEATGRPQRLLEDHGVCLSSNLDYWEDDLFIQAFSRNLILAPQTYGSPWFLRDDEFPKLARIYNLTRHYRDILPQGMMLDEKIYGPSAVSRGNDNTRVITLRNPSWQQVTYTMTLDEKIGIGGNGPFEVRRMHPSEKILGSFNKGESVKVTIPAFRACVVVASSNPSKQLGINGCTYEVVRDVPGKPALIKLLGMPGTTAKVTLPALPRKFTRARIGGIAADDLLAGKTMDIVFPGKALTLPWHRKLADLKKVAVPADAIALYEATCYAADNNAMEIRSIQRAGTSAIAPVKAARDAFLAQQLLIDRGVWDRYLFDKDPATFFRLSQQPIWDGALRIDMGAPTAIDQLVLENADASFAPREIFVSANLKEWTAVPTKFAPDKTAEATVLKDSHSGTKEWQNVKVHRITADIPALAEPPRYIKLPGKATNIGEASGFAKGKALDKSVWRASNVFADYNAAPAKLAMSASFRLDEVAKGSYLTIPCHGEHGRDGVYAALRIEGKWIGAPLRAWSYPANPWEHGNGRPHANLSYFIPVTPEMTGKNIDVVVMQFDSEGKEKVPLGIFTSELWITTYPIPYAEKMLTLDEP